MTAKLRLFKQIFGVVGLQATHVVLSAVIGFLIVRSLAKEQYAMFSLLNVGMATMLGWASGPLAGIFIPFAARISPALGMTSAVSQFKRLSRPMLWSAVPVSGALMYFSAQKNDWVSSGFVFAAIVAMAAAICQYLFSYIQAQLKQTNRPTAAMGINVIAEAVRCALVAVVIFVLLHSLPADGAVLALVVTSLVAATITLLLARRRFFGPDQSSVAPKEVTHESRVEYWSLLRPVLFPSYFFATMQIFKGGLIYLLSPGDTIADAAALGRLMMLISLFDKTIEYIVLPRLGLTQGAADFKRKFSLGLSFVVFILGLILLSAWLLPAPWLWLLGGKYTHLDSALLWTVAAACVERVSGYLMFGQFARGMTRNQWWIPVLSSGAYFALVAMQGLATAEDAGQALFVSALVGLACQGLVMVWNFRGMAKE